MKTRLLKQAFLISATVFFAQLLAAQTTETFNTPGTHTWTVPSGVTSITVEGWGAGAGGDATGSGNDQEGGGGGAYAKVTFSVTAGENFNYTIGEGGSPNESGENTTFSNTLGSARTLTVDAGNQSGNNGGPGGSTGSTNQTGGTSYIEFAGGDGGNNSGSGGGGGGASGSPAGNGGDGNNGSGNTGGSSGTIAGGTNGIDGGKGGKGGNNNQNGANGITPGGGGGGRGQYGISGSGGDGQIRITYTRILVDLKIENTVNNVSPAIGDNVTFTLTASNLSGNAVPGVTVDALLPVGYVNLIPSTTAGSYDANSGEWTIGAFAANATATLTIEATVSCADDYFYTSTISNTGATADDNQSNNAVTVGVAPQYGSVVCLSAQDDDGTPVGDAGGVAVADVLANDLINGSQASPNGVVISIVTNFTDPGITFNTTTREVTVAPNTPAGNHFADYKIAEIGNPSNFSTARVRVFISDLVDGYINLPEVSCNFIPVPTSAFGIQHDYKTDDTKRIAQYSSPLAADLDGDGVVEIIALSANSIKTSFGDARAAKDIHIFNGVTGALIRTITTPYLTYDGPTAFAVADVDGDGKGEIIVAALYDYNANSAKEYLFCYEHDGTQKWKSDAKYGANAPGNGSASSVGIADFNEDGTPEVYVYNEIFNALTGKKLVDGGANGIGNAFDYSTVDVAISVAGDLTSNAGLELAAGKTVYEVNISNTSGTSGNSMTPINFTEGSFTSKDGFTSLADLDLDGNLDVIVSVKNSGKTIVYAWNPRNTNGSRNMGSIDIGSSDQHGAFFVGDVDKAANGIPEVGLCQEEQVEMLSFDPTQSIGNRWSKKWTLTTSDGSGRTGITMFDFNQDGVQEMVYRDETQLRIFDGSGSSPSVLATFNVNSNTGMEGPIIVDVDGDGSAEILVNDQVSSGVGRVSTYESSLDPWAPARGVWNQYAYFNTHISDDLSIPQYQSNHSQQLFFDDSKCSDQFAARPLNMFNVQSTYFNVNGCPTYPVFDAAITITSATLPCPSTLLTVEFEVSNYGDLVTIPAGTPIAFYEGNPFQPGATFLTSVTTSQAVLAGQTSPTFSTTVSGVQANVKIYAVVNDDGQSAVPITMPTTNILECDYTNNAADFTTRCENLNLDINITHVNVPVDGDVSTNDNVPLTATYSATAPAISKPSGSTPVLTLNSDGTYTFVADKVGKYVYDVEVCVPSTTSSNCGTTKLSIIVTDATITSNVPAANSDIAVTEEGVAVVLNTLSNDVASTSGRSLDPASVSIVSGTAPNASTEGTLSVNSSNGEVTFTPVAGFTGTVFYDYQVCESAPNGSNCAIATQKVMVVSTGGNAVTAADDYSRTQQETAISVTEANGMLANDVTTNPSASLSVSVATAGIHTIPGKGTFNISQNGAYLFTPAVGFSGPVNFPYEVCDGTSCANATLYILVDPFETTPDINSTFTNVLVNGNVSTNDNVGSGSTYNTPTAVAGNPNAVLPTINADGTYAFTPTLAGVYNFNVPVCLEGQTPISSCDTELLTITVQDQSAVVGVAPTANTDVAATKEGVAVTLNTLANDLAGTPNTTLDNSSVTIVAGTAPNPATEGSVTVNATTGDITFTPVAGFTGAVSYTYQVCDDQSTPLCTQAIQTVSVFPTDAANKISASDDYVETKKGIATGGNVGLNDKDPEGDALSVNAGVVTNAAGSVTFNSNGTYTFTPAANFTGPGEFIYTNCDNKTPQACTNATLHVLVKPEEHKVSGKVWYDPDGLTDNAFDGTAQGTITDGSATTQLYVNYLDDNGNVAATTAVASDGTWEMDVLSYPNSKFQLSKNQGVLGQPKPTTELPAGWGYVGEGTTAAGDGAINGEFTTTVSGAITNLNFGFEKAPITTPITTENSVPYPDANSYETVDASLFTGTDIDGTVEKIRITSFPTNAESFKINNIIYYPNALSLPSSCPNGFSCVDFSSIGSTTFFAHGNAGGNTVPNIEVDPISPSNTNTLQNVVFEYKVIDNANLEDQGAGGQLKIPFQGARTITITKSAVCIDDVPYLEINVVANFDPSALDATITWTSGTPNAGLPATTPASPIVNTVVQTESLAGATLNGSNFEISFKKLWPGAGVDSTGTPSATDWPGWVLNNTPGSGWQAMEDGYSGYRENDTEIEVAVNPDASTTVDFPPSTPFCASTPRVSEFKGTVWHDVDGSGTATWTNIQNNPETGTNAGGLYAYVVGISPATGLPTVLDKATVAANGTFAFTDCIQGTNHSIVLSTDNSFVQGDYDGTIGGTPGNGVPTAQLPVGWAATSPATRTGINTENGNVLAADMGIQQIPTSGAPNLAGVVNNNELLGDRFNPGHIGLFEIPAAGFGGDDNDGDVTSLTITDFSANVLSLTVGTTTYYKGSVPAGTCPTATCAVLPSAGVQVPTNSNGQPTTTVGITPIEGFIDGTTTVDYKVTDNAAAPSDNTTTLEIPFIALKYDLTDSNPGWNNGSDGSGKPNATDGDKTLFWLSSTGSPVDILDIPATVKNIIIATGVEAVVSSCLSVNDGVDNKGSILFKAISETSYGQYLGPEMNDATFEMHLNESGWHNMAFPFSTATKVSDLATLNNAVEPFAVNITGDPATQNLWRYDSETSGGKEHGFFINRSNPGQAVIDGNSYSTHAYGTWNMALNGDALISSGWNYYIDNQYFLSAMPYTIQAAGTLNAENQTFSTHNNFGGWNLIPNVFPVTLDVEAMFNDGFFNGDVDKAIWIWDPGDSWQSPLGNGPFTAGAYVAVDAETGNAISATNSSQLNTSTQLIAPMQSFYVRRTSASQVRRKDGGSMDAYAPNAAVSQGNTNDPAVSGSVLNLVLKTDYRSNCQSVKHYKTTNMIDVIMLAVTDNDNPNLSDATEMAFASHYTNGYDAGYDVRKMSYSGPNAPTIFTILNENQMVINKLAYPENNETVPVGFYSESTGNYTISGIEMPAGWNVYLEDKYTGEWHDLTRGSYSFKNNPSFRIDRFVVHFNNTGKTIAQLDQEAIAWGTPEGLTVSMKMLKDPKAQVMVTNILGQVLYQSPQVSTNDELYIPLNQTIRTAYLVTVVAESYTETIKVIR